MVDFPIDQFLVGSDISPVAERAADFPKGLTDWRPSTTETGMREPQKLRVEANGYEAAMDQMNQMFLLNLKYQKFLKYRHYLMYQKFLMYLNLHLGVM